MICDRDQVIAAAGTQKKEMIGQSVSRQLEDMITYRESTKASDKETSWIPIVKDDRGGYTAQLIYPIICEGDAVGGSTGSLPGKKAQYLVKLSAKQYPALPPFGQADGGLKNT